MIAHKGGTIMVNTPKLSVNTTKSPYKQAYYLSKQISTKLCISEIDNKDSFYKQKTFFIFKYIIYKYIIVGSAEPLQSWDPLIWLFKYPIIIKCTT